MPSLAYARFTAKNVFAICPAYQFGRAGQIFLISRNVHMNRENIYVFIIPLSDKKSIVFLFAIFLKQAAKRGGFYGLTDKSKADRSMGGPCL